MNSVCVMQKKTLDGPTLKKLHIYKTFLEVSINVRRVRFGGANVAKFDDCFSKFFPVFLNFIMSLNQIGSFACLSKYL